jgi:hypothetical protein
MVVVDVVVVVVVALADEDHSGHGHGHGHGHVHGHDFLRLSRDCGVDDAPCSRSRPRVISVDSIPSKKRALKGRP